MSLNYYFVLSFICSKCCLVCVSLCFHFIFYYVFYYVFLHVIMCVYFYLFYFFICMNLKSLSPICTYTTNTLHSSPTSLPTATCMIGHTSSLLHETKPSIHMPTCMEPCLHVPSPFHFCMTGWFPFTLMHNLTSTPQLPMKPACHHLSWKRKKATASL